MLSVLKGSLRAALYTDVCRWPTAEGWTGGILCKRNFEQGSLQSLQAGSSELRSCYTALTVP